MNSSRGRRIPGEPVAFPMAGPFDRAATALLVIDMQKDFCAPQGYMHNLGCDLEQLERPIGPIQGVLAAARAAGLWIGHTREGYAPDLSDLQPWKKGGPANEAIGIAGPLGRALVRGEPGWDFLDALPPMPGEHVYDKSSYGAFLTTTLEADLRAAGIANLILTGVTTDCCVTSTLREGLDRGFDCMVLEDCVTAASPLRHKAALDLVRHAGGVFGTLGRSKDVIAALQD
ncbi:MAG: cysteine hydrolase [Proteobacteria bacterium]|nr:cysteine hydrolase [Pseudomonadota bacterium]